MTFKECCEKVGGNYDDIVKRFEKESTAKRFVAKFLSDTTVDDLDLGIKNRSAKDAFFAAHTLKGICINLGFDELYRICSEITESLREKQNADCDFDECTRLLIQAKEKYDIVIDSIKRLDD